MALKRIFIETPIKIVDEGRGAAGVTLLGKDGQRLEGVVALRYEVDSRKPQLSGLLVELELLSTVAILEASTFNAVADPDAIMAEIQKRIEAGTWRMPAAPKLSRVEENHADSNQ